MKELIYYGVEKTGEGTFQTPATYHKGLYSRILQPGEDEETVRREIETRCRSNPDANFAPWFFGGIKFAHFKWIK